MLMTAFTAFTGCTDDDDVDFDIPTLELISDSGANLEEGVSFDENGGDTSFQIVTTGAWKISGAEGLDWLAVQPAVQGTGNQKVALSVAALAENEGGRSAELKVAVSTRVYGVDKVVDTKTIKIAQTKDGEQISEELIYGNNFDKAVVEKVNDRWPYLDQTDVWQNQEGTGAATVTYEQKGCSVRTSGASGGYDGASGSNKIFFGQEFVIKDITLPEGKTNFSVKFGGNYFNYDAKDNHFYTDKFFVQIGNGAGWSQNVAYEQIGGDETQRPNWVHFEAKFSLKEPVEKLSIKFIAKESSRFSIDDVKFFESVGGQQVEFEGGSVDPEPQPQPQGDAIYANNFDKADAVKGDKGWPYLDQTDCWMNHAGTGAAQVAYAYKSASVRQSGKLSGNYPDASAHNKIFFGSTPAEFEIQNIELPTGKRNFRITFGGNYYNYNAKSNVFDVKKFLVTLGNGTSMSAAIDYMKVAGDDQTDPYWTQFAADVTLPEGTSKLTIKFEALEASVFAIDDVVLTEGNGGQEVKFEGGSVDPDPQPQPQGDAIYANNFDKADAQKESNKWPYLDASDCWINHTGSGVATVTYETKSMSARQSGKLSGNYPDASARNKIFFGTLPAHITVKTITLPAGKRNFRLTFGGNYYNYNAKSNVFDVKKFPVTLGNSTSMSAAIDYKKVAGDDQTDPYWTQFAADFTLPEGTSTLDIKFEALEASVFAIDDVVLTEGNGGQEIKFEGGSVDPEPQPEPGVSMTIAEVIALGQGQPATVEAQIVGKHQRGFMLQDATGRLYVYTATDANVGDTVKVEGTTGAYNDMFQVSQATVTLVKAGEFMQPAPEKWDGAKIEAYAHGTDYTINYVEYEGVLDIQPNQKYPDSPYYNIVLEGTAVKGSLVNPLASVVDASLNGQKVVVKGYTIGASGKTRDFFNTMAVEVKKAEGGSTPDPEPQPAGTTIAEVLGGMPDALVSVEGQVVAKHSRGFLMQDTTGIILVYAATDYAIGDFVKVEGTTDIYANRMQIGKKETQTTISLVKNGQFTQPAAEKMDGAAFDAYKAAAEAGSPAVKYVEYEGVLTINGFYYNIAVEGTTLQGSLGYVIEGMVDPALNGQKVNVKGYTLGMTNRGSMISTMLVEIAKVEGGVTPEPEPQPQPDPQPGVGNIVTFDMATLGSENIEVPTLEQAPIHIAFDKGTNNLAPKYYGSDHSVRMYANNTMTLTGATITKVEFTYGSRDEMGSASEGTLAADRKSWTGKSTNLTFTVMDRNEADKSAQARVVKMVVYYE